MRDVTFFSNPKLKPKVQQAFRHFSKFKKFCTITKVYWSMEFNLYTN